MTELLSAAAHPTATQALDLQEQLWAHGCVRAAGAHGDLRAAGALDCLIAAYAIVNDANLLHSDHDFEYIAEATRGVLQQEYVAE